MGFLLSILSFVASFALGRHSLGAGMTALLTVGYFYGFLRARFLDGFSHFMFDAGVLGLYLARFTLPSSVAVPPHARAILPWLQMLIAWPTFMFVLCFFYPQHPLIQLVGLRAALWFLPFLLLGATVQSRDLDTMAFGLAVLNLIALGFALGEYFLGLETFFPRNAITELMYRSKDVGESVTFHRIPGPFVQAAAYGGVMVSSLPLLIGCWQIPRVSLPGKTLLVAGLFAATMGTFLCGSRTPVVFLFGLGGLVAYHFRFRLRYLVPAGMVAVVVAYFVLNSARLQRFTTLENQEYVVDRIQGSANLGFVDLILEYPLGAGLGSAFGTNIPTFLIHLVERDPIGVENEYGRIAIEQGLPGLFIWLLFLGWFALRRRFPPSRDWETGVKLMAALVLLSWATAFLGAGMLTAIPGTVLLLFQMGVAARSRSVPRAAPPTLAPRDGRPRARVALPRGQ